jgi:hypothetical protein
MEKEIEYLGVKLTVHYTAEGKYYPQTCDYPEEFPEIIITRVFAGDVDISGIFLDCQFDDLYKILEDGEF